MADNVLVEIIAYAPTAFYHCTHCEVAWRATGVSNKLHDEQVRSSLPADLASDYQAVSDWVREMFSRHGDRLLVRVIDAASLEGVLKSLRYGVRRYPGVIVGRQARYAGSVQETLPAAGKEIDRQLSLVVNVTIR